MREVESACWKMNGVPGMSTADFHTVFNGIRLADPVTASLSGSTYGPQILPCFVFSNCT